MWLSAAGTAYTIQTSPNLESWRDYLLIPGDGAYLTPSVPMEEGEDTLFFRLGTAR